MKTKKLLLVVTIILLPLIAFTVGLAAAQGDQPEREAARPEGVEAPDARSNYIPVQGRLTDASGNPLTGSYDITFNIYDQFTEGTALCSDTRYGVTVENGLFVAYMEMTGCGAFDGRQLYLGLQVGADAEMTPRQFIDNVPYAWSLRPGAVMSYTLGNNAMLHIENWAVDGRGLRAYAMSQTGANYGVVGASRSPDGFGGYFYNNSGGGGLLASSNDGNALTAESINSIAVLVESVNDIGLWSTSVNAAGVHGASGAAAGVEGFSLLGPGVYAESLSGAAIAANGVITSSEPTYLWISGNDVRPYQQSDSTIIDMDTIGGAFVYSGADVSPKNVMLPITLPGTLYGQNVKVTGMDIYYLSETEFDGITAVLLRRQTGVCANSACYLTILYSTTDYTCDQGVYPTGCTQHFDLTNNNVLTANSGVLYLTIELNFGGPDTFVEIGGVRLTLEYDD